MDFFNIATKTYENGPKKGEVEVFPDFVVGRSEDLMVRSRSFYAIWDEEKNLWSTDEYEVQRLVDAELKAFVTEKLGGGAGHSVKYLRNFSNNAWAGFRKYLLNVSDNAHTLDTKLTFANTEVKKSDYVSRRLPYALEEGDYSAWDELVGTLYSPEERAKIEWVIGAIVSGDSTSIQKFLVFYGPGGTGKSTILNIIDRLFEGYTTTFEAKALGSNNNAFATEAFKDNPLVAIQQDGDLSEIQDNSKLNSIISHEYMTMNEKFKPSYTARVNAFLLMGTNKPVKISDAKSGIIRRLIDVHPTGELIRANHYNALMARIEFELGAIAYHCLERYRDMGKNYYKAYRPLEMMLQTDVFFNFIEANYDVFKAQDGVSLKQAYVLYKEYCADTGIDRVLPQYKVREELRNYFDEFYDRYQVEGVVMRSMYVGFNANKFKSPVKNSTSFSLVLEETESLLDEQLKRMPAMYARTTKDGDEVPEKYWSDEPKLIGGELKPPKPSQVVSTTLEDLDTSKLHFVKVPEQHIVIDFDLKDKNGKKSLELNMEKASQWPSTYAELSKGGAGVHLHYMYNGDVSELSGVYSESIEIKTLLGDSSLRRRLTKCNNVPIAPLAVGTLPVKEKKVQSVQTLQSEKGLRDLIARNLKKEIHPGTKPSIDFIHKILEDAYNDGLTYDVTDLRPKIMAFSNNSQKNAMYCLKKMQQMKFVGQEKPENEPVDMYGEDPHVFVKDERIVFFDVEVFSNLLIICWKFAGDPIVTRMINPSAKDIEQLMQFKLVGFNNRRYDNHILWAAFMGYSNADIYRVSKKIIDKTPDCYFGEAYSVSYTDIFDFSSKKQSLKKFQIELGLEHKELGHDWDKPLSPEHWDEATEYCVNDVVATEATFDARKQDFVARQILADLSGLTVNDPTLKHTTRIIFGRERNPQRSFVYTDLSKDFPGYSFDATRKPKSEYRGEDPGEGGYVYAEPGMYENVALLDVASMHPTSIEQLNLFGDEYTPKFSALKAARVAIKRGDYESARQMLDGKLAPFLGNVAEAKALSDALKIVINIVYGVTSATFDNPFRDRRNKDNIVAKRGALFMIDLKHEVQARGFTVAHIKTDSIKIPNATPEIIEFVTEYGKKYGYDFEHEATYKKFCLVNDAVYIARKEDDTWEAVGAQFQHSYVFKALFTKGPVYFEDLCETKQVAKGAMYLDFEHETPEPKVERMQFVGRSGSFVPINEGHGGGVLYVYRDEKLHSVSGTKGHMWVESHMAASFGEMLNAVDMSYFDKLKDKAVATIEKFGSFDEFVS